MRVHFLSKLSFQDVPESTLVFNFAETCEYYAALESFVWKIAPKSFFVKKSYISREALSEMSLLQKRLSIVVPFLLFKGTHKFCTSPSTSEIFEKPQECLKEG